MISFIKGKLISKGIENIIVENSGMGFEIRVPANSKLYLNNAGDEVIVYTIMLVKEDDISLCGFDDNASIDLFKKLTSVSGVGAKAAMAILSLAPASEIQKAIAFEDVTMITKASGIGKKTAQRVVLELKDKFDDMVFGNAEDMATVTDIKTTGSQRGEAVNALIELGYSKMEAMEAVGKVADDDLSVEEYIKSALKGFA